MVNCVQERPAARVNRTDYIFLLRIKKWILKKLDAGKDPVQKRTKFITDGRYKVRFYLISDQCVQPRYFRHDTVTERGKISQIFYKIESSSWTRYLNKIASKSLFFVYVL